MHFSVFDLFSIGIGPSSSHTVGPMKAALHFVSLLQENNQFNSTEKIKIDLYGSLALTGKGHGTDAAILMGLEGEHPQTIDPDIIPQRLLALSQHAQLNLGKQKIISFSYTDNLLFHCQEVLPYHTNGLRFTAFSSNQQPLLSQVYYSIGGGFIVTEQEAAQQHDTPSEDIPFPFETATELLRHCQTNQLSIAQLMLANEKTWRSEKNLRQELLAIAEAMFHCIEKGCSTEGILPGGLNVKRRAPSLYKKLMLKGSPSPTHPDVMNWLNVFAMAVNEQNAAGGRVVTAPTNGAAGIIPAVLRYYQLFCDSNTEGVIDFLLTAGAIAILYKKGASISGAEVGCQGEVGVACSMAAGALTAVFGGSVKQVEKAAEIGMEHNLGLTCDPIGGLVQIPCIERNAMGAVKAVNAARLVLAEDEGESSDGDHIVTLDNVIATMRQIGKDMMPIYKETSLGGLAKYGGVTVNIIEC